MSPERVRGPGTGEEAAPEGANDAPVARAPVAASAGGRSYSEEQVAEILRRAARLERARALQKPQLSLAEVEAIARESGLDPSLVRVAARSLEEVETERSLGTRLAGAPIRRSFERVIDGELSVADHEQLVADLRGALVGGAMRPPQISSVGRSLTATVRAASGLIELTLTPRDGKTLLRIQADATPMAGGFFGGLVGGLSGGFAPLAVALTQHAGLGVPAMVLAGGGVVAAAFTLARTLFSWRANALYRRIERLADTLEGRVREELSRPR